MKNQAEKTDFTAPAPNVTFALDLRRCAEPSVAVGGADIFCDIPRPSRGFDAERGLRFPLPEGCGLLFQNHGKLNDASGSIVLTFSLDTDDEGG